jgi:hypothetical protein
MPQPEAYASVADRLWEFTQTDWHVCLGLTLTEPVCAIVDLQSDDDDLPILKGFIGNGDANESIRLAGEYMLKNLEAFYSENPAKRPQK